MKRLAIVATALIFAACAPTADETAEPTMDAPAMTDSTAMDSTATDSTAAAADSTPSGN